MAEEVVQQDDAEPEGTVEIELPTAPGQKQRMAPVSVISAERKRAVEKTEQKLRAELEPYKQKAEQLEADLAAVRPHLDYVRQNWDTIQKQQQQQREQTTQITDEEAEAVARDLQLYGTNGLDLAAARRVITRDTGRVERLAKQIAEQTVAPALQATATQQARANFAWAASQKDTQGNPLVDATELAQYWATLPPQLAANAQVAELLLEAAVGRSVRSGKRPQRTESESVFSEAPGGQRPDGGFRFGERERRIASNVGMTEKQFTEAASRYQPGRTNVLGD